MSMSKQDGPPPLTKPKERRGFGSWLLMALFLVVGGGAAGLMAGAVWAYSAPKKYESRAVVQVMPVQTDGASWSRATTPVMTRQFFATQFEIITAFNTLERAVDRLDLATRWNLPREQVVDILDEIVSTEQIRGTDLIEIRVRFTNPMDARDIADAVASAYLTRMTELAIRRAEKALEALDADMRDQEDLVEEKRRVLDTIVQAIGIPYVEGAVGSGQAGQRQIAELPDRLRIELEAEQKQLKGWIDKLTILEGEELYRFAVGLKLPDNGVPGVYQEYRVEVRELQKLVDAGMGDAHPKVVAQSARVDMMGRDLNKGVTALREILETQSELLEKRLEKITLMVNSRSDQEVDRALESHDYIEAKREYEGAQMMLQKQKLMHSSQRISLKIPKMPVVVHEHARVGKAPVSPRVSLCLGAGAVGGGMLGFAIAVLVGLVGLLRREAGS